MRGIDQILAAIVLAGAVAGTAVFARHLGSVPQPQALNLAAPTPQHATATVRVPPLVRPELAKPGTSAAAPQAVAAAGASHTLAPATPARASSPTRIPAATPAPASTPAPAPPVQQPTETRVLAAVPLTPVTPLTPAQGNRGGHGWGRPNVRGREKGRWARPDDAAPAPAAAPSAPQPLLQLAPSTPFDPSADDWHGSGLARGGKSHRD